MQSIMDLAWGESGRVPLVLGAVLLYVAARIIIAARGTAPRPGAMALIYWIGIAVTAIVATCRGRSGLGLAIVLGTSVASLSLVQGSVILVSPRSEGPLNLRRLWPFVMPATLLVLMAGFAGTLTRMHALIFLAEGAALLIAWNGNIDPPLDHATGTSEGKSLRWELLGLAVLVAAGGGLLAMAGAWQISQPFPSPAGDLVVPALLGPILIIPLWIGETSQSHQHQAAEATTTAVGIVLLNLCLLLPTLVLLTFWKTHEPMVYSWLCWRVDTVVLLLFGFILLPPALGRWRLGHAEGITLLGLYVVYVLMGIVAVIHT